MEKLKVSAISCLCGRQRFLHWWSVNIGLSNGLQAIYSISIIVNQMWYADCFLFLPKVGRNSLGLMHFFSQKFCKTFSAISGTCIASMTQVECYFQDLEEVLLSTMQKERFWAMLTYRERDSLENWSFVMNLGHIYLYFIFQIFCRSVEWVRTFASDWNNLSRTTARCIQRVDADRFSSIKTNLHFNHVFLRTLTRMEGTLTRTGIS